MQAYTKMKICSKDIKGFTNKSILMLESFINEGSQPFAKPENLKYSISLTDGCIGWKETEELIFHMALLL